MIHVVGCLSLEVCYGIDIIGAEAISHFPNIPLAMTNNKHTNVAVDQQNAVSLTIKRGIYS